MEIMLPAAIRKLSCNPGLRTVAHHLHISPLARRVYCQLLSSSGTLRFSCLGVEAVFKADNSKQLAFVDYILTTESATIEAALRGLKEGDTFVDVGCHFGIFTILASKLVGDSGRVIAIDPFPEAVHVLKQNIAVNGCRNVEVWNVALSDTTGPLALAYSANCAQRLLASEPPSAAHMVQGMAGDEVLRGSQAAMTIKIDVEGQEFAVLTGLKQTLCSAASRKLCIEIHPTLLPAHISEDDILRLIRNCGFQVTSETPRSGEFHVIAEK
jgi:FkbM family methyltransferase